MYGENDGSLSYIYMYILRLFEFKEIKYKCMVSFSDAIYKAWKYVFECIVVHV